jgi:hypothetical protein
MAEVSGMIGVCTCGTMALPWNAARRLLGRSASSPDPFFNHSCAEIAFRHNSRRINHGAFEEGLDKINRIFRITGIG